MPHDDFQVEPVRGLPETPPDGERILWQGAPSWRALARDAFKVHWVAVYFGVIALWRAVDVAAGETGLGAALLMGAKGALPFLILGAAAIALLALSAYVQARTTVYTITNRRVAMRIGAALTVTLNLPYRWIGSADLRQRRDGVGTIALALMGPSKLSYAVCWPHVRPWRMSSTEPALRCIPDAERVAGLLREAAEARLLEVTLDRGGPTPARDAIVDRPRADGGDFDPAAVPAE